MKSAVRWIAWFVTLTACYEVLEDSPVPDELIAGAVVAVLSALLVLRLRAVARTRYAIGWNDVRQFAGVPLKVLQDIGTVTAAILRSFADPDALRGKVDVKPYEYGEQFNPQDAGRRAMDTVRICLAPGSVVCMMQPGKIAVHHLEKRP